MALNLEEGKSVLVPGGKNSTLAAYFRLLREERFEEAGSVLMGLALHREPARARALASEALTHPNPTLVRAALFAIAYSLMGEQGRPVELRPLRRRVRALPPSDAREDALEALDRALWSRVRREAAFALLLIRTALEAGAVLAPEPLRRLGSRSGGLGGT